MSKRNEVKIKMLDTYNLALVSYRQKDFKKALTLFEQVLEAIPGDGPSKLYVDRCKNYIENPPPEDWDGVFTMTTK